MEAGKYHAKAVDYGISTSKAGLPLVNVKFAVGEDTIIWTGSFNEGKAQEFTMKTLILLGLRSTDKIAELVDGVSSGVLDLNKTVEIDVAMEEYEGKLYPKVKWVNDIGFRNAMSKEDFKAKIQQLGVKGTFTQMFTNQPKKTEIEKIPF